MKLSELKGEAAINCLADIIEPAVAILSDKEVVDAVKSDNKIGAITKALKLHKKEVADIVAALDGVSVDEINVISLPMKLLEILNDPIVVNLFQSQGQTEGQTSSGSASENIEA